METMDELLKNLMSAARQEGAVAQQTLTNDMCLLVYPMHAEFVIGLGFEGAKAHVVELENVIRKRSGDMARFGSWLPAMFADGGIYVVRRTPELSGEEMATMSAHLMAAEELLT
jgi:hypothetical protein